VFVAVEPYRLVPGPPERGPWVVGFFPRFSLYAVVVLPSVARRRRRRAAGALLARPLIRPRPARDSPAMPRNSEAPALTAPGPQITNGSGPRGDHKLRLRSGG
jgi:hypothetical protein